MLQKDITRLDFLFLPLFFLDFLLFFFLEVEHSASAFRRLAGSAAGAVVIAVGVAAAEVVTAVVSVATKGSADVVARTTTGVELAFAAAWRGGAP